MAALLMAAAAPGAHAGPASLKNGKWEITYRTTETGLPAPAEAGQPEGKSYTRTFTSCNRKAASEKAMLAVTLGTMRDEGRCTRKPLAHSGSGDALEITCAAPHAATAVFRYEAEEGEQVISSTDEQRADGVKEHIEASARRVGACSSHS